MLQEAVAEITPPISDKNKNLTSAAEKVSSELVEAGVEATVKPLPESSREQAAKSRETRIAELFAKMSQRQKTLLGIVAFCREPRPINGVNTQVEQLEAHNRGIYSPAALCRLLEEAGAIERVDETGNLVADKVVEPSVVEDGENVYLEVGEQAPTFWRTTSEGAVYLDNVQLPTPQNLFAENAKYLPIYQRILTMAAEGVSAAELAEAIDHDPILENPKRYAMIFVEQLKECDAIEWNGTWHLTDCGRNALEEIERLEGESRD